MTVRPLLSMPAAVLRTRAKKVPAIDKSIQRLIDDMIDTMHEANGVGLAAPQVGVSLRVVVLQLPEKEEAVAIVNPQVVKKAGANKMVEGCLSLPGQSGEITRADTITVKGLDRKGGKIRIKAEGLLAQALQHELDHLDGTLYIDHLEEDQAAEAADTVSPGEQPGGTA